LKSVESPSRNGKRISILALRVVKYYFFPQTIRQWFITRYERAIRAKVNNLALLLCIECGFGPCAEFLWRHAPPPSCMQRYFARAAQAAAYHCPVGSYGQFLLPCSRLFLLPCSRLRAGRCGRPGGWSAASMAAEITSERPNFSLPNTVLRAGLLSVLVRLVPFRPIGNCRTNSDRLHTPDRRASARSDAAISVDIPSDRMSTHAG
jgi:hypothetical protein